MSAVSLEDIDISYGSVDVVRNLDLDIKAGEFVVFVGPSGCGKSTTLRLIAGPEEGRSGNISIGGRIVNDVDPANRPISLLRVRPQGGRPLNAAALLRRSADNDAQLNRVRK